MIVIREYHGLSWLADVWNIDLADLAYLAENDHLKMAVRVFEEAVEEFSNGPTRASDHKTATLFSGLLSLRPPDVFAVFRDGDAVLDVLVRPDGRPLLLQTPKFILMGDLVVSEIERRRYEATQGRGSPSAVCFRAFKWEGQTFSFTNSQVRFLECLYVAAQNDRPWVSGKKALEEIGSALIKPGDLFRRKPHWRDIVDHDQKGNYRLQPSFLAYPPW